MYEKEHHYYKGMTITVYYDENAESPANWDNPECFLCSDYRDLNVDEESISADECREAIYKGKYFLNGFYIFPVSIYDHSGLALHLGEAHGWDYSNGWAFVCVRRKKGWWTRAKAREIAKDVLDEWNTYLSGNVYEVVIEDSEGQPIDACGGYYGAEGLKDAVLDAKSIIDDEIKKRLDSHLAIRKAQIKGHAPLYARAAFEY